MTDSPKTHEVQSLESDLWLHREELAAQNDELRRANGALTAARARLALLFDAAPTGYATLDSLGTVVEANLTLAAILGLDRRAIVGASFDTLVDAGDRARFRSYREGLLAKGGSAACELALSRGANTFVAYVDGAVLPPTSHGIACCMISVRDETERRRLDGERRAIEARLAEIARLESLAVMAGGVAHDFNNLLAIVLCHLDFATHERGEGDRALDSIAEARAAALKAAALAKQMLAYTGRSTIASTPVDFAGTLRAMEPLLVSSIASRAALRLTIDEDLPFVRGDAIQLQQVVMNLVLNAAEAMPDGGGTIDVTLRSMARPESASVTDTAWIELAVRDDGSGMDEATRRRAFDPFFSTKFVGRGLGLAVVAGDVRGHGGGIECTSQVGVGTTFRLSLPAIDASAREVVPIAPSSTWRGEGLVLVVDDEAALRPAIARMVRSLGFTVVEAADGFAAIEVLARSDAPIVAALVDATMPKMSGVQTIARLREQSPQLPVVLMSGDVGRGEAASSVADAFLAKPFDRSELGATLRTLPGVIATATATATATPT